MNWVKTLNDIDKNFYDKCADLSILSLYETEDITNETMTIFQDKSIKFVKNEINIEEVQLIMNEQLVKIQNSYNSNEKKFIDLFKLYSNEITDIVESKRLNHINIAIKRVQLSNQKCNGILKSILVELQQLQKSLIVDFHNFLKNYFIIHKNDDSSNDDFSDNISNDINKTIEKTKTQYNKIFKQRDLIKYLESNGFTYKNTGRHANFTDGINTIPVPMHGSKELGYGLQRKIQKEVIEHKNK